MPLIINSLEGGHTDTVYSHIYSADISMKPLTTVLQYINVTFSHLTSKAQTVVHN